MPVLTLYLFESDTRELLVIGCDKTGGNLRRCKVGLAWLLCREINPAELPAEVVLTAYTKGFCFLDEDQRDPGTEFEPGQSQ